TIGDSEFMRFLCQVQAGPTLCWFKFMRMASGLPRVRATSTNFVQEGCTRRMYPMTSFLLVALARRTTFRASATVVAIGFSMKTWHPASKALSAYDAWVSGYVLI